jgi:hypothetical protein
MGFLDKVKEQAAVATAVAKDAAQKGQAKLDTIQAKRAADAILRDLGVAVYAQQTGRGTAETQADIERLTGALHAHEEANGPIALQFESPAGTYPGAAPPPTDPPT